MITAWKELKYGVIFGPYFPVFGLDAGKYGPEKTPYLDTFHAVDNDDQNKSSSFGHRYLMLCSVSSTRIQNYKQKKCTFLIVILKFWNNN